MAPFNKFAKKLHLDKKSSNSSTDNTNSNKSYDLNTTPNTSMSSNGKFANASATSSSFVNNSFSNNSFNPEIPNKQYKPVFQPKSQQLSKNSFNTDDHRGIASAKIPLPQQTRIFPTPQPVQQRNVSGAVTTLHHNQKEYTPWNRIKLTNSPFPRYRHVASSYESVDNEIFVIGGLHDQSVYGDTWSITSTNNGTQFISKALEILDLSPPPRVGHASTLCGNAFVVFGGDTHKVNKDGLMDDDIYLFNINSHKWTIPSPVGPRPLGRYGHKISIIATSSSKTKLYLFGGQFDDTYFNDIAVFDLSSFRRADSHWEFIKPKGLIPPPMTNHTMVTYDNKLWVFGGDTKDGLINDIYAFDPADSINTWTKIDVTGDIPCPVQEHSALIYDNLMCVIGGKDENDMYLNSVHFFNFDKLKWFKFPIFKSGIMQGRSGHSISLLNNNKILIMGGDKYDFARPSEADLHTSDTNQGAGTILYTLDLTRLPELCAGINDKPTEQIDLSTTYITPSTPQLNKTKPPTTQNDMILAAVDDQNAILTPYANDKVSKTPTSESSNTFSQDNVTSLNNIEKNTKMAAIKPNELLPVVTPTQVGEQDTNNYLQIESVVEPVENADNFTTSASTSGLMDEGLAIATVVSSPTKVSLQNNTLEEKNINEISKVAIPDDTNASPLASRTVVNDEVIDTTKSDNVAEKHSSKVYIEKSVIEQLRLQLEEIKRETQKSAKEASDHIHVLELENKNLKANSVNISTDDLANLKSHTQELEADIIQINTKNKELETLLDASFLDVEHLNKIIKTQSKKLSTLYDSQLLQQRYDDLETKYNFLMHENESLKSKLDAIDGITFNKHVHNYSSKLDQMIDHWKNSKLPSISESPRAEGNGKLLASSRYHQQIIDNLSTKLDNLIINSDELLHTKERLSTEYKSFEMKHTSLSQEFIQRHSELTKAEQEYKNTLNSVGTTLKELASVQKELVNTTVNSDLKNKIDNTEVAEKNKEDPEYAIPEHSDEKVTASMDSQYDNIL
ncbi:hypothetical protein TPHA_0A05170 [Tetrapisispora phaffii CBS 4417]|uniref:Uncharacterized protein n=1 Tax=Tetrapisispora phaffii (strain ATCC 24235 / CBS 4417 / NBRC 1672 / NRRL Y-8282 / UCD 70-5) TaxID=1071381 RepID=G8BNW4_TETPH|nr:hypothetical protein TPHA_0A05170 [Tetrapisispora phaffii CBS 4417]CCE61592.1 hypothetical protein TPHA_0A05170 [Tetrapisispora phaffii CBS 4417]